MISLIGVPKKSGVSAITFLNSSNVCAFKEFGQGRRTSEEEYKASNGASNSRILKLGFSFFFLATISIILQPA